MNRVLKLCFGASAIALGGAAIINGYKYTKESTAQDGRALGTAVGLSLCGSLLMAGIVAKEAYNEFE